MYQLKTVTRFILTFINHDKRIIQVQDVVDIYLTLKILVNKFRKRDKNNKLDR